MRIVWITLLAGLLGCGAEPRADGGADAADDGSSLPDAGPDGGIDAGEWDAGWRYWDGEEMPETRWTVPDCAAAFGTLGRQIQFSDGSRRLRALHAVDVAADDGLVALSWRGEAGVAAWGQVQDGEVRELERPELRFSFDPVDRIFFHAGRLLGTAQRTDMDYHLGVHWSDATGPAGVTSVRLQLPGVRVVGRSPLPLLWAALDDHFRLAGEMDLEDPRWRGIAYARLNSDFEAEGPPMRLSGLLDGFAPQLAVAGDGERWLLVRGVSCSGLDDACNGQYGALEVVPFDDEGVGEARYYTPFVRNDDALGASAVYAGGVVVATFAASSVHPPQEHFVVELDLATGEALYGPEPLSSPTAVPGVLTAREDGRVDYVRQPTGAYELSDRIYNTDNPLEVYLARERPLSLEGARPFQLGGGAYATEYRTARDSDRLAVVWKEFGPQTERTSEGRRTVESLYWAILRCDDAEP